MNLIIYLVLFSIALFTPKDEAVKAPDFEFTLGDGTVQSLSDYKGKVVYLSFWASWCAPCMKNYNRYYNVRRKLQEMGVVLLNVSIDKSEDSWEKSLKEHYIIINGVNGHASDLKFVKDNYELSSIPLYEILNKKGEFVYLSETQPRDIYSDFKNWLEE